MKKFLVTSLAVSVALSATIAVAQVFVDKTKMREWNGAKPTTAQVDTMIQRHADVLASREKFNNIISPAGPKRIASTNPDVKPNDVIDDGTRINFNITNWWNGDFIGIGSVRPVFGTSVEPVATDVGIAANAVYVNGKIYAVDYTAGGGQVMKATFKAYDAETWTLEKSIDLQAQWYSVFDDGAYNPKDGKIYVLGYSGTHVPYISELNPETGTYTHLVYCPIPIEAMTFDANGTLYAITAEGEIEIIDINTGNGTPLFRVEAENVRLNYWHTIAFDYHTGELFWVKTDNNFMTDLRKIDLETKTVEVISDLPDFGAEVAWVESPKAPDKAPNTVEKLFVEFGENGSHIGTINVTAPSVTFDGTALSGDVTITVSIEDKEVGQLTLTPGAAGTIADVDFGKSGEHKVTAVASNAEGNSPSGSVIAYCGPDTPMPASDVKLTVAKDGTASLSWVAPKGGIHQGYFNADLVTYDIIRYPDNTKVATGIKTTTYTETLPSTLNRYHYTVTSACDGIPGEPSASNSIVYGDGYELPFYSELGGEDFFNLATIYDVDGDGNTWYETWGSASCYTGWHENDAEVGYQSDDWYITPPIVLTPGNYYVETSFAGVGGVCSMEFAYGSSQAYTDQKVIKSFNGLRYEDGEQVYSTYITITEADKYYFGYHFTAVGNGDPDTPYITIRNLKVEQGPQNDAPEAVTDVNAVPAELGKLETTITFKTPSTTFTGSALSKLDRVEICTADNEVVGSVSPVEPGKTYEFVHKTAVEGYNTYKLYAYNAAGRGKKAEVSVYAGNDLPGLVSSLDYKVENNRVITFEWGAPSTVGVRGGYVNPDDLTYNFCRSEYDWQEPFEVEGATGLTERTYTWTECQPGTTFGTTQHMYLYGIRPINSVGQGQLGYTGIILGDPCQAPFRESFAGGHLSTSVWTNQLINGVNGWAVTSNSIEHGITTSDNDSGMLLFAPEGESFHAIGLPLIELRDMQDPVIIFDMYHSASADESFLSLQISQNDEDYVQLAEIKAKADAVGWTEHKISLKDFNGGNRLFIALAGIGYGKSSVFAVDNIRVCDDIPYDIALQSLTAPKSMDMGETAEFKVKVESKGLETVEKYAVDIYADGVKVATVTGGQLASGSTADLTVNVTTNAANAGKNVVYEARVNLDSDCNVLNNTISTTVSVGSTTLSKPENLTGTAVNDVMTLKWSAPGAPESSAVNETMESWSSFAIDGQNDWKFYDGDRLVPYGIQNLVYPNMDKGRAWMVWAPDEIADFGNNTGWEPYDGSKCLIAFASSYLTMDGGFDFEQQSNDWLISPHVVGGSELKFMAGIPLNGYTERFEVMVSYGSRNPEDFTPIGETVVATEAGWKQYTYTLPADAAYFAIRYVSAGSQSFALMIDNIEYTAGYGDVELIGYNIYLNGKCVTDTPLESLTADVNFDPEIGSNVFGVSAVYFEGESEMATLDITSGIDSAIANGNISVVSNNHSIIVEGAEGLNVCTYNTLGYMIDSRRSSGRDVIAVQPGVYIVSVNGHSYKIAVKQ